MQEYELVRKKGDPEQESRALWEEIFTEDCEAFLDYYYRYKVPDAWVYLLLFEGEAAAMLHLNPYLVWCNGTVRKAYYIVGVATKTEHRHRGCMARLLRQAIADATEEGCPFLFLMPADPAIYTPFGFRYGYVHQDVRPCPQLAQVLTAAEYKSASICLIMGGVHFRIMPYETEDAEALSGFAMAALQNNYRTFCVRDGAYYERLKAQLNSEGGELYVIRLNKDKNGKKVGAEEQIDGHTVWIAEQPEQIVGYFRLETGETPAVSEAVVTKEAQRLFDRKGEHPAIMFLGLNGMEVQVPCYFPEIV